VVSLWENVTWSTGQTGEMTFRRTCNFDAKTGELLGFSDVFTDPAVLPALLGKALADKYPELPSVAEIEPVIAESLETNNGIVCFALANGGVHIFAEKNPLDGLEAGILQAMLSYEDYPELVKPEYRTVSDTFVTKLAYDTDHILPDGTTLRMSWDIADEDTMDIRWSIDVGGNLHSETFYGYAPECYVVYKEETAHLYLRVPAGDITNCTAIYEITSAGLSFIGEAELAMYEALNHHPDRMLMVTNDLVYSGYALLQPYGLYRVDETGMPVPAVSDVFGLRGPTLALTRDVEATFADLMDEQFEDGPLPLEAGTLLTPYRTDKASYIDFLDENGNVCRFAIERYADDMTLNNYGTLEELLEPVDAVG